MYNLHEGTEKSYFPETAGLIIKEISNKSAIRYIIQKKPSPHSWETLASLYMSELPSNCHSIYLSSMSGDKKTLIEIMEYVIRYAKDAKYTKFYYADNTQDKKWPKVAVREHFNFKQIGETFESVRTLAKISQYIADVADLFDQINTPPAKPKKAKETK